MAETRGEGVPAEIILADRPVVTAAEMAMARVERMAVEIARGGGATGGGGNGTGGQGDDSGGNGDNGGGQGGGSGGNSGDDNGGGNQNGDLTKEEHRLVRAYYVNRDNPKAREQLTETIGIVREKNKNATELPDPKDPNFHDLMIALAIRLGLADNGNTGEKLNMVYGSGNQNLDRFGVSVSVQYGGFEGGSNPSQNGNGGATEGVQSGALSGSSGGGSQMGSSAGGGLPGDRLHGLDRADQVAGENGQGGRDRAREKQE